MEWISVEDSMPDIEDYYTSYNVLVAYQWGNGASGRSVSMGYYTEPQDEDDGPTWYHSGRDGYRIQGVVTHWMPLPEYPHPREKEIR